MCRMSVNNPSPETHRTLFRCGSEPSAAAAVHGEQRRPAACMSGTLPVRQATGTRILRPGG